ncbi:hypothetical protein DFP96_11741 [Listeria rocourtiae]|uniref:Uncharacterized protein n=1 Tax=Listeria rocourtiae TaxID=647910 RepID=A0A4R6ZG54_9LIST|nr:hypothetical protein DFP96_11741 [Listeria rocourtiae]
MDFIAFWLGALGLIAGLVLLVFNLIKRKPKKVSFITIGVSLVLILISMTIL